LLREHHDFVPDTFQVCDVIALGGLLQSVSDLVHAI
jgi:hypothetical protein